MSRLYILLCLHLLLSCLEGLECQRDKATTSFISALTSKMTDLKRRSDDHCEQSHYFNSSDAQAAFVTYDL